MALFAVITNEISWSQPAGSADVILDNLIAQHKAIPL